MLPLSPELLDSLQKVNITEASPIQKEAIPVVLAGKDLVAIAATGSGKTLSFVLPILENLKQARPFKSRHVQVLVLTPTRELAIQVCEVFKQHSHAFSGFTNKAFPVYGGVSINPQMIDLPQVNILVATPGRLLELVEKNAIHLADVEILVLDEADKMLNLGFAEEMKRIFALLPPKRQTLLFSATLNHNVVDLQKELLHEATVIDVETEDKLEDNIKQTVYRVASEKKGPLLRNLILKKEWQQVLVFVGSSRRADNVADKLRKNGIEARPIHSKKSQNARMDLLVKFKLGHIRVLVATDLLSRGVDIEELPYVVNYELPRSPKDYIHRIGRTGRAGAVGEAITLLTPAEEQHFKVIQKKMQRRLDWLDSEDLGNEYFS